MCAARNWTNSVPQPTATTFYDQEAFWRLRLLIPSTLVAAAPANSTNLKILKQKINLFNNLLINFSNCLTQWERSWTFDNLDKKYVNTFIIFALYKCTMYIYRRKSKRKKRERLYIHLLCFVLPYIQYMHVCILYCMYWCMIEKKSVEVSNTCPYR